MIKWLEDDSVEIVNETTVYSLDVLRKKFEVKELRHDGWLVLNWDKERFILEFAVLEFHSSEADGADTRASLIFHGVGPTDALRECRHTWWGDEGTGYVFYPNGPVILAAFQALSEFYDDMLPDTTSVPEDGLKKR